MRVRSNYPTQGVMLDNLIRDATAVAELSSSEVYSSQVEDLLEKVKNADNDTDFEEKIRQKSQLLNVAFGSVLHFLKNGCSGQPAFSADFGNVVGMLHWFQAGLLEGSLRAFEHLKEKHEAALADLEENHRGEVERL